MLLKAALYLVFHNSTLAEIAGCKPQSLSELAAVPGVGPTKLERFGDDVLKILDRQVASPSP
jgi:ATP-dependent DNA helicase RecQ